MAYTFGECTYGAYLLASWLPTDMGNASTWVQMAAKNGLSISQSPVVGSAMVFTSSYPGSEGDGHVGIVTGIGSNGYPIIKEMNAGRNGGGFDLYDTYQTNASDLRFLEGYIVPPDSASASTTSASTLASQSPSVPLPYPGGVLNPMNIPFEITNAGIGVATGGGIDLNPTDWVKSFVGGIFIPIEKMGEIFLGAVVLLVGFYFIAKDAGAPGVTNIIGKIPGISVVKGLAA